MLHILLFKQMKVHTNMIGNFQTGIVHDNHMTSPIVAVRLMMLFVVLTFVCLFVSHLFVIGNFQSMDRRCIWTKCAFNWLFSNFLSSSYFDEFYVHFTEIPPAVFTNCICRINSDHREYPSEFKHTNECNEN